MKLAGSARLIGAGVVLAGLFVAAVTIAGPLDPPAGPVTSTYKTLSEIEPRTCISPANTPGDANSLYRITAPGSYCLCGNISGPAAKHAIEIESDNVTLDLNGFSIIGLTGSLDGITVVGNRRNLAIRNGTVRSMSSSGIYAGTVNGGEYTDLIVQGNAGQGLWVGSESIVRNVRAISNGSHGFHAELRTQVLFDSCIAVDNDIGFRANDSADCNFTNCSARENREQGFNAGTRATFVNCQARGNDIGGILAGDAASVTECQTELNTGAGLTGGFNAVISGCRSVSNSSHGFSVNNESIITDCLASGNSGSGIVSGNGTNIDRCAAVQNTVDGIVGGTGATISNNRTRGNGQNGIRVNTSCHVLGNACDFDGSGAGVGAGIRFEGSQNCIEGNNLVSCENNVFAPAGAVGNLVVRNSSRAPTSVHFNFAPAGNAFGPFVVVTGVGDITSVGNSNHPQANLLY